MMLIATTVAVALVRIDRTRRRRAAPAAPPATPADDRHVIAGADRVAAAGQRDPRRGRRDLARRRRHVRRGGARRASRAVRAHRRAAPYLPNTLRLTIGDDRGAGARRPHCRSGWIVFDDATVPAQEIYLSLRQRAGDDGRGARRGRRRRPDAARCSARRCWRGRWAARWRTSSGHYLLASKVAHPRGLMKATLTAAELFMPGRRLPHRAGAAPRGRGAAARRAAGAPARSTSVVRRSTFGVAAPSIQSAAPSLRSSSPILTFLRSPNLLTIPPSVFSHLTRFAHADHEDMRRSSRWRSASPLRRRTRRRRRRREGHRAEGAVRLRHRRRLPARQLHAVRRLPEEAAGAVGADDGRPTSARPKKGGPSSPPSSPRPRTSGSCRMIKAANRRLALAENLTDEQARAARARRQDGGLDRRRPARHRSARRAAADRDHLPPEHASPIPRRCGILNDVVILCTLVNPDGMELVSNWYMREADEKKRSTSGIPRLYQKYIGHDDNRDFYMMNMSESVNANRMMYREWFPAIMYNHHQTGPAGAVLFAPPFRDPFNYNFDPLIPLGIDTVGAAIHTRLAAEGKPGAVMRTGAPYSTWFNGGIRTTSYFHNQIGILTETIGNPTPVEIPFVLDMQLPRADVPNPIAPRTFHFRDSDRVLDHEELRDPRPRVEAARGLPLQHVQDGEERHRQGQPRHWTIHPKRIEAAREAIEAAQAGASRGDREHRSARRPRRRFRPRRRAGRDLQQRPARSEDARSARLHPAVGSAGLPHRDEVRQHADQGRRVRAPRDGAVHRRRQVSIRPARTSSRRRSRSART